MATRLLNVASQRLKVTSIVTVHHFQRICTVHSEPWSLCRQIQPFRINRQFTARTNSTYDESKPITKSPRTHLHELLLQLQKDASSFINQSRLQLALRGLEQTNGEETIRVAILGVAGKKNSARKSRQLARLLIADPLKPEADWERVLQTESSRPVILKISSSFPHGTLRENGTVQELSVSSTILDKYNLEILVLESNQSLHGLENENFMEALMVPKVNTLASNTGRYTQLTMPVHRALIVSEDVLGAAIILRYPTELHSGEIVKTAIDLPITQDQKSDVPCQVLDIDLASHALNSFRQSTDNALLYEKDWSASGLPEILSWLKQETSNKTQTRAPLQKLISSALKDARKAIEVDQKNQIALARSSNPTQSEISKLRQELQRWSLRAHTELRDQLEIAFHSHTWQNLSWWKLFWRVDDVSMIASNIINQRFLARAEQEIIFLAGRIMERGFLKEQGDASQKFVEYELLKARLGAEPPAPQLRDFVTPSEDISQLLPKTQPWPQDIRLTQCYLSQKTVPALQALAQQLVIQTLSASSLATVSSALIYFSSVSFGIYEAGIVAALGIVLSLKRIQNKWEIARRFWEDEVKEEGRKSVKNIEISVNNILTIKPEILLDPETQKAKCAIQAAEDALKELCI